MLTTAIIRETLKAHMDKESVVLGKVDHARDFWMDIFDSFNRVVYIEDSKKWEQNYDVWEKWYCSHAYGQDDISLYFYADQFKKSGDELELVSKAGKILKRFNKFVKQQTGHDIDSATL